MPVRLCLTCKFHSTPLSEYNPKEDGPRPCAPCIARSGYSKWEPIDKKEEQEDGNQ